MTSKPFALVNARLRVAREQEIGRATNDVEPGSSLGFREGEAKRALERATGRLGNDTTKETLLRGALRELDRAA